MNRNIYAEPESFGMVFLAEVLIEGPLKTRVMAVWDAGEMLAFGVSETCAGCGGGPYCDYPPLFDGVNDFSDTDALDFTTDRAAVLLLLREFADEAKPEHVLGLGAALEAVDNWLPQSWHYIRRSNDCE